MTWTRIGDGFNGEPILQSLSRDARLLHVEALVWCNQQLTDGVVPRGMLARISDSPTIDESLDELLASGLWTLDAEQVQVDWSDQELAQDVRRRQQARAEKQRRDRNRRLLHQAGNHSECQPGVFISVHSVKEQA